MVTTATIDLISYTGTATDKGSTKSCADDNGFENVFESVNKSYSSEKEHSTSKVERNQPNKTDEDKSKVSKNDAESEDASKTEESGIKEVNDDSSNKGPSFDDREKTAENDSQKLNDNNVVDKTNNSENANVENQKTADLIEKIPEQANLGASSLAELKITEALEAVDTSTATVDAKKPLADNLQEINLSPLLESLLSLTPNANNPNSEIQNASPATNGDQLGQIVKDIIVDSGAKNALTQNVAGKAQISVNVKPQVQQALFNVDNGVESVAKEAVITSQAQVETPMVEVAMDALSLDSKLETNPTDVNLKNILNKTSLTQEVLDKTNAKIISVETSSSNSNFNNLLSGQNSGEQIIKMTLQSENSNKGSDMPQAIDAAIPQPTFTKTLDNVQVQTPKEISGSEILSQINSKLDSLQDETTTKVNIVLKPEGLGKINLELVNSKDGLVAKMTTDNAQVKQLLDKNLDSLRDSLGNQGLSVNTVSVKVEETQKQSNDMFSFDNSQSRGENQGSSNNSQSGRENESAFSDEMEKNFDSGRASTDAGESVSEESYASQVNYKV